MARFRSGDANIKQVSQARVFRGAPTAKPSSQPSNQGQLQQQQIAERIKQLEQEQQNLAARSAANRFNNGTGGIISRQVERQIQADAYGIQAELNFYRSAATNIQGGTYYTDYNQVQTSATAARTRAIEAEKLRMNPPTTTVVNVNAPVPSKKPTVTESKGGEYIVFTDPNTGVSTFITREGEIRGTETAGYGNTFTKAQADAINETYRTNLAITQGKLLGFSGSPELKYGNYQSMQQLIKSGFVKEQSTAFGLTAAPIYDVYYIGSQGNKDIFTQPVYFESKYTTKAKEPEWYSEEGKSTGTIIAQRFKQFGIGVGQKAIGLTEGTLSYASLLGTAKVTKEQGISFLGNMKQVNIGFEKFKQIPISRTANLLSGGFVYLPLVVPLAAEVGVGGYKIITRQQGIGTAIKTFAYEFSPFKPQAGYYGALESGKQLKYNAVTVTKEVDGQTIKIVTGKDTGNLGVKLYSEQQFSYVNDIPVGKARTTISSPVIELTRAGDINVGQRAVSSKSLIKGNVNEYDALINLGNIKVKATDTQPSTGKVLTKKIAEFITFNDKGKGIIDLTATKYTKVYTGGVSYTSKGNEYYVSGTAKYGITPSRGRYTYRVNPTIKSIEFTQPTDSFTFYSAKPITTKAITGLSLEQVSASVSKVEPIKSPTTTKGIIPTLIKKEKQVQQPIVITKIIQTTRTLQITKPMQITSFSPAVRTRQQPIVTTRSVTSPVQKSNLEFIPLSRQDVATKQELKTRQVQRPIVAIPIPQPTPTPEKGKPFIFFKLPKSKGNTILQLFSVQVRRQGKFKTIAVAPTIKQAFTIGRIRVNKTLAATFKITGTTNLPTPVGFKRKVDKRAGLLFIEQPKYRLNTPTEIKEIKLARMRR